MLIWLLGEMEVSIRKVMNLRLWIIPKVGGGQGERTPECGVYCERNRAFHKDILEKLSESLLAWTIRRIHHLFYTQQSRKDYLS